MKRSRVFVFLGLVSILVLAAACGTPKVATPTPVSFITPTPGASGTSAPATETPGVPATAETNLPTTVPTVAPTNAPTGAPTALPGTGATATRIQFASGATEAILTGHLPAQGAAHYVLRAGAGQVMRVSLSPDQGQVILIIWGADGNVLISDHAAAAYWAGVLPATQDYFVDVRSAPGAAVDYTLQVVIPERIQFAPGGTSASVKGTLPAASTHSYVLGAAAGQTMSVDLSYAAGQALIIIWGADGTVLISDHAEARQWSGVLPVSQDYYIDVRSAADSALVAYTLTVTIPPSGGDPQPVRIQFPAGGTSATVQGSVAAGSIKRYVLKALAGQTMNVVLVPAGGEALIVIFGADGNVLISDHAGARQWSGVLPSTQDYTIDVHAAAGGGTVAYALGVTIPPAGGLQATRIQFAAGATSATVSGNVASGGVKRYVVGAAKGQTMTVTLTPSTGDAFIAVWGQNGSLALPGSQGDHGWSGVLPATGDYFIDITAFNASPAVHYSLKVVIPPR